jgi:exodeoxyribonuclease VII small subunit
MADEMGRNFEDVQTRLSQIVDEVSSEDISLDDALKLYEEAVKLGLSACDLSEQDIDAYLGAGEPAADGTAARDTAFEDAETAAPSEGSSSSDNAMPANEPSFFENIWQGIFGS